MAFETLIKTVNYGQGKVPCREPSNVGLTSGVVLTAGLAVDVAAVCCKGQTGLDKMKI